MNKFLIPAVVLMGTIGCSTVHQTVQKTEQANTNGVVTTTYTIDVRGQTALQSQQTLDKSRATATAKTASVGLTGLDQKSDGALMAEAMGNMMESFANAFATAMSAYMSGGLVKIPTVPTVITNK